MTFLFRSMYTRTIIRFGFCDIYNNQDLGKGITKTSSNNIVYNWWYTWEKWRVELKTRWQAQEIIGC